MQDASRIRRVESCRSQTRSACAACGVLGVVLATAVLASGCGLKGALTLPEKPRNVVIRPAPGAETQSPAPPTEPEPEPLPPPELPPDTRGNTRG